MPATAEKKTRTRKTSASAAKPKATRSRKAASKKKVSDKDRYLMISEAAYYLAESQGFKGDRVANWLEAEKQIDKELAKKK